MKKLLLFLLLAAAGVVVYFLAAPVASDDEPRRETQTSTSQEMAIVLAVPSVHDEYYAEVFDQIVDFHIRYANVIHGNDRVRLLVDADTREFVEGKVPDEILVETDVADIWMRDFTTVNPYDPVQFSYNGDYFDEPSTPQIIQKTFNKFLRDQGIKVRSSKYILDGGNLVDNYQGSIVVSERFLEDNMIDDVEEAQEILMAEYGAEHVAIIPYDDPVMGHADGMVMFVDDVLLVNRYEGDFRMEVLEALSQGLPPTIDIVEVESDFEVKEWKNFSSACGVNINSLVTEDNIYVPTFGNPSADSAFVSTLAKHTNKMIHTIDARNVCFVGGSVRCLSWQIVADVDKK